MYIEKTNKRENRYTYEKNHDNKKCHDKLQKCIAMLCVFAMITCLCVPFGGKYIYADDIPVGDGGSGSTQHKHKMSVACEENVSGVIQFNELNQDWINSLSGGTTTTGTYKNMQSGYYYLTEDISVDSLKIKENTTVFICLNGHNITGSNKTSVIDISGNNSVLNLCDCKGIGKITGGGDNKTRGGGIRVGTSATFNMYGGHIDGNTAYDGGGVCVSENTGVFNMYGGAVCHNKVYHYAGGNHGLGGGVYCQGTFNLYNGGITDNWSEVNAGGVYVAGTFNMHDGVIARNSSDSAGGGIYIFLGTVTVMGGSIEDNTSATWGGAISHNGGILDISGGQILANQAPNAAGIYGNGSGLKLSEKPYIWNNTTTSGDASNVTLLNGKVISITGELDSSAKVGISMHTPGTFTSGWEASMGISINEDEYFVSDDLAHEVNHNGAGELWLGEEVEAPVPTDEHKHDMSVECATGNAALMFEPLTNEKIATLTTYDNITRILPAGAYYLQEDLKDVALDVKGDAYLCLNGKELDGVLEKPVLNIVSGTLYVCDCVGTGTVCGGGDFTVNKAGGIHVSDGRALELYGGNIAYNKSHHGGGVNVGLNATFKMYGGDIHHNEVKSYSSNGGTDNGLGGGVYVANGGTFDLINGEIYNNNAIDGSGGGICAWGTFTMEDGKIYANEAYNGGGLNVGYRGTSTIKNGIIESNDATYGGGVCLEQGQCTLNLYGGNIINNKAARNGGAGIYQLGKLNIKGSNITVKGNKNIDNAKENIYIRSTCKIAMVGAVTNTDIGISMENPGTFTTGWPSNMGSKEGKNYFLSDDSRYGVNMDPQGEVMLGEPQAVIHKHDMSVECENGSSALTYEALTQDVIDGFPSVSDGEGKFFTSGNYYLTEDIDVTSLEISYNTTVNLCLNGHKITGSHQNSVIKVETNSGKLNICDCQEGGMITGGGSTGEGGTYGGGIYIQGGATFNMYGGEIAHNKALVGGGVWLDRGTFNMYGGNIHDNQVKGYTINVSTYSPGHGGGVYIGKNGAFNLIDGELYNNSANICFEETRGGDGAAVYCYGTFIMEDGRIYNNKGFGTSSVISASNNISKVTINGGSIDNNISEKGVGGIKLFGGVLNLNGGTINNNDGYGVYAVQSTINLLGKNISIQNNKDANNVEKNMFLQDNQKLNITGLLENSDIGITMVKSQSAVISDNPGIFTVGWPSKMGDKEGKNYFSSDNPKYEVVMADDGEVMLAEAQEEVPKAITISGIHLEAIDIPEKWTNLSDMRAPKEEVIIEATGTAILNDEIVYRFDPTTDRFEVYATVDEAESKDLDSKGKIFGLKYNLTETGQYIIYAEGEDDVYERKYLNLDVDKPDAPYLLEDDQTKLLSGSNIDVSTTYAAVKAPEINQYQSVSNMYYSFEGSEFKMLVDTVILTPASDGKLIMRTIDLAGNVSEDTIYNVKKKIVIVAPPEEKPSKLPSSPGKQPAKGLPYYYKSGDSGEIVFIGISQLDEYENAKYVAPKGKKIYFKYNTKYFVDTVGHWAKENIDFVTEREIFIGTHPDRFSPNKNMTRGMFATVLGRMYERSYTNIPKGAHSVFSDVDPNLYYNDYITWANQVDILRGYEDGKFYPDKDITREEMAAIMYRFAKYLGEPVTSSVTTLNYADADSIAPWFQTECLYVQNYKLMEGRGNGLLKPKATALRCEVSAVIERFVDVLLDN